MGIIIRDLDLLTIGIVNDMYCESGNDSFSYARLGTQEDFDRFRTDFLVALRAVSGYTLKQPDSPDRKMKILE